MAGAVLAGAAWVAVPVLLRVRYGVLEVISTLLLNFVAEATTSLVVQGPLQESQGIYPQSDAIAQAARLPLLPGTRLHAGILVALAGAVALWHLFAHTIHGFQLRAVGLGPRAAEISGRIDSRWVAGAALAASGAIAGLAGGIEVAGVSYALFQNLSPGYGFTAIAVALLGRLHPFGVVLAGVLFGALEAGAGAMQREAGVPAVAVYVVEAVVILVVLLAESLRRGGGALAAIGSSAGVAAGARV
jgi:simple sugar transport system permease protein